MAVILAMVVRRGCGIVWRIISTIGPDVSVPAISIAKFVIQKPSCDPVWAVDSWPGQVPVVCRLISTILDYQFHRFILRSLDNIAPIVRRLPFAVLLEVAFLRNKPPIDRICLFLKKWPR